MPLLWATLNIYLTPLVIQEEFWITLNAAILRLGPINMKSVFNWN